MARPRVRRKPQKPEQTIAEAVAEAASEGCLIMVEQLDDEDFQAVHDTAPHVAACERCGLSSNPRTSEQKARAELAAMCAERLAQPAGSED